MRSKVWSVWVAAIPLCLVTFLASSAGAAPPPNESQVEALVHAAVNLHTQLPSFSPSLESLGTPAGVYAAQGSSMGFKCDPDRSAKLAQNPKPCWYGNTSSKRVVVLFGDSNAGNWIPAMNLAMKQLDYKLAVFVYPGCWSQIVTLTSDPGETSSEVQSCNLYHSKLPAAVKKVHPVALISTQLGEGYSGSKSSFTPFAENWKKTFDVLTAGNPHAIRILMGTTPANEAEPIPVCLSRYLSSSTNAGMTACSPHYYPGANFSTNTWSYWQRDQVSATVSGAHLISTDKWFCDVSTPIEDYCPAVIDKTLVYVDTDHISIDYMYLLQGVVSTSLISAGLKAS